MSNQPFFEGEKSLEIYKGFRPRTARPVKKYKNPPPLGLKLARCLQFKGKHIIEVQAFIGETQICCHNHSQSEISLQSEENLQKCTLAQAQSKIRCQSKF